MDFAAVGQLFEKGGFALIVTAAFLALVWQVMAWFRQDLKGITEGINRVADAISGVQGNQDRMLEELRTQSRALERLERREVRANG